MALCVITNGSFITFVRFWLKTLWTIYISTELVGLCVWVLCAIWIIINLLIALTAKSATEKITMRKDLEINWRIMSHAHRAPRFANNFTRTTWFYDLVANHGNELIKNTLFFFLIRRQSDVFLKWNKRALLRAHPSIPFEMYCNLQENHTVAFFIYLPKKKNADHKILVNLLPILMLTAENNYRNSDSKLDDNLEVSNVFLRPFVGFIAMLKV